MENIIRDDGYINATELCKKANKRLDQWKAKTHKSYINFINILSKKINLPISQLIKTIEGRNGGTWIHPLLATHLAQWISAEFAVNVSIWIEEWKTVKNNHEKYNEKINNLVIDEQEIVKKLQQKLGGKTEVETQVGNIDLLTDTHIFEVKIGNMQ